MCCSRWQRLLDAGLCDKAEQIFRKRSNLLGSMLRLGACWRLWTFRWTFQEVECGQAGRICVGFAPGYLLERWLGRWRNALLYCVMSMVDGNDGLCL